MAVNSCPFCLEKQRKIDELEASSSGFGERTAQGAGWIIWFFHTFIETGKGFFQSAQEILSPLSQEFHATASWSPSKEPHLRSLSQEADSYFQLTQPRITDGLPCCNMPYCNCFCVESQHLRSLLQLSEN
jgi:hypothetical protein